MSNYSESSVEPVGRGRPGRSRYRAKRTTVIPYRDFVSLVERLDSISLKSLVALLYYVPLRISEIVGDSKKKWRVLSAYGRGLSYQGTLPKGWTNSDQKNGLWDWRQRDSLPGILKEDITLDGLLLKIQSKPLKHGKRDGPLEIDIRYPLSNLIIDQWEKTEPEERVWAMTAWRVWKELTNISEDLYPHAFRFSRTTDMARDPNISLSDMLYWFGWAQARTADKYIQQARSTERTRASIERSLPAGWDIEKNHSSHRF